MVRSVLEEQARVLRPGGHVAFEVGEVRSVKFFSNVWYGLLQKGFRLTASQ